MILGTPGPGIRCKRDAMLESETMTLIKKRNGYRPFGYCGLRLPPYERALHSESETGGVFR